MDGSPCLLQRALFVSLHGPGEKPFGRQGPLYLAYTVSSTAIPVYWIWEERERALFAIVIMPVFFSQGELVKRGRNFKLYYMEILI